MTGLLFGDLHSPGQHVVTRHVPDTSKAAHTALVNSGRLNGRKAEVLAWLLSVGPTSGQTAAELSKRVFGDHTLEHVLHIRRGFSDLKAAGLVCKGADRACSVTNTSANTWKVVTR